VEEQKVSFLRDDLNSVLILKATEALSIMEECMYRMPLSLLIGTPYIKGIIGRVMKVTFHNA